MPLVPKRQVLDAMAAFAPIGDRDAALASMLAQAGLRDKPLYRPEEVAALGAAMMGQARQALGAEKV